MLRVLQAGPSGADTRIVSTVCASCPHGPAGCCASPPRMDWSDVGRIASDGGRSWLLAELAAGRLAPCDGGLALARRKGVARGGGPRIPKCVYHDRHGCTLPPERRPGTCNYYVCESALAEDARRAEAARATHAALARAYTEWDAQLAARVAEAWPEGPPWDHAFLAWLGDAFARIASRP